METQRAIFLIDELDCAEEVRQLRVELERVAGIEHLDFDVMGHRMYVTFAEESISEGDVLSRISGLNMRARVVGSSAEAANTIDSNGQLADTSAWQRWSRSGLTAASGVLLLVAFAVHAISVQSLPAALGLETADAAVTVPRCQTTT